VCGSILSGRLTDLIGRKRAILITAGIFTVGSLLCAIATSTGVLIEGRIAIGVAIGVASYTAPLYIGEMAPPKLRGGLVTLNRLAITVGILVAYIIDATFASSGNWRLMFGFGVFPALALGLGIAVLPSPRDLLVEVRAISVNPVDAKIRAGSGPGKLQGELSILGWDAVGVVREVGTEVTLFKPGDEIYCPARCPGSYAEFQCVDERIVRTKPGSLDFAAAAALPLTTITHGDFYLTVCALCRMAGKAVYSRQDRGHGGA
jgi:MFS family permease